MLRSLLSGGDEFRDMVEDTAVTIDAAPSSLELRKGERRVASLLNVEDVKGGHGDVGELVLTTLRVIWRSTRRSFSSVVAGWDTVADLSARTTPSRLRGDGWGLVFGVKGGGGKLEFIFSVAPGAAGAPDEGAAVLATARGLLAAYQGSRLYRELKLRAPLIKNKAAVLLPGERLVATYDGVWNLSADQGNLGILAVTSLRIVWHCFQAENFNVSVPYGAMADVRARESKFGRALVFDISPRGGDYLLGFRVDPPEKLDHVVKELNALRMAALASPNYGVAYTRPAGESAAELARAAGGSEDVAISDPSAPQAGVHAGVLASSDVFLLYYASVKAAGEEEGGGGPRPIHFAPSLGLAVEEPPPGLSLETLWTAV